MSFMLGLYTERCLIKEGVFFGWYQPAKELSSE